MGVLFPFLRFKNFRLFFQINISSKKITFILRNSKTFIKKRMKSFATAEDMLAAAESHRCSSHSHEDDNDDDDDEGIERQEKEAQQSLKQSSQHHHQNMVASSSPRRTNSSGRMSPSSFMHEQRKQRPGSPLSGLLNTSGGSPPKLTLNPPLMPRSPRVKVRKATQMLFELPPAESPRSPAHKYHFQRVQITGTPDTHSEEAQEVGSKITRALELREKYLVPMPVENWGGLDPQLYTEFMAAKDPLSAAEARRRAASGQPAAAAASPRAPMVVSPPTTTTASISSSFSTTSSAAATHAAAAPAPAPAPTAPSTSTTSTFSVPPLRRSNSTNSTGARQRLRRRMDVPYNPYLYDLAHEVPPELPNVSFTPSHGVFRTSLLGEEMFDEIINVDQFYHDLDELLSICNNGPVRSFSYARLKLLGKCF